MLKGDVVKTLHRRSEVPISWIGTSVYYHGLDKGLDSLRPVYIKASSFSYGSPSQDLIVSASAGLFFNGKLVRASSLINSVSIRWFECDRLRLFSLGLPYKDVIIANNVGVECYVASWFENLRGNSDFVIISGGDERSNFPYAPPTWAQHSPIDFVSPGSELGRLRDQFGEKTLS